MALALNRVDFLKSFRDSLIYKAFQQFTMYELIFLYWYRAFACPYNERTGVLKHLIKQIIMSKKNEHDTNGSCNYNCCKGKLNSSSIYIFVNKFYPENSGHTQNKNFVVYVSELL